MNEGIEPQAPTPQPGAVVLQVHLYLSLTFKRHLEAQEGVQFRRIASEDGKRDAFRAINGRGCLVPSSQHTDAAREEHRSIISHDGPQPEKKFEILGILAWTPQGSGGSHGQIVAVLPLGTLRPNLPLGTLRSALSLRSRRSSLPLWAFVASEQREHRCRENHTPHQIPLGMNPSTALHGGYKGRVGLALVPHRGDGTSSKIGKKLKEVLYHQSSRRLCFSAGPSSGKQCCCPAFVLVAGKLFPAHALRRVRGRRARGLQDG
jgi:hypothetical protein